MLSARIERWPIAGSFTISRGAKTEAVTVVAEVSSGGQIGRGECVPYPRYGETPEATLAALKAMQEPLSARARPASSARRRCLPGPPATHSTARWSTSRPRPAASAPGTCSDAPRPNACITAYTISLGTPEVMAAATAKAAHRPLLKIKLGGDGDGMRIAAVRKAAPDLRTHRRRQRGLDAGQSRAEPERLRESRRDPGGAAAAGGSRRGARRASAGRSPSAPTKACTTAPRSSGLRERYDAVNIKLDKTGGLTEALAMADAAQALGFEIMIGCMVATSLAMAPAMLLASQARFVDLDGPLLLARDREAGLRYDGSLVYPPEAAIVGMICRPSGLPRRGRAEPHHHGT